VSVMSTVLGSLAPDLARGARDTHDVLGAANPPSAIADGSHNVALPDGFGPVYNEEAFRYFLQIERKRASRSNSRFLLLLVDLKGYTAGTRFDAATGAKLFAAMYPCLRETDFIGWYRQQRVASAVLTQVGESPDVEVSNLVAERVREALTQRLPAHLAARLQVRVYQVPASTNGRS
jgi:GGDEF domain-containing protein